MGVDPSSIEMNPGFIGINQGCIGVYGRCNREDSDRFSGKREEEREGEIREGAGEEEREEKRERGGTGENIFSPWHVAR